MNDGLEDAPSVNANNPYLALKGGQFVYSVKDLDKLYKDKGYGAEGDYRKWTRRCSEVVLKPDRYAPEIQIDYQLSIARGIIKLCDKYKLAPTWEEANLRNAIKQIAYEKYQASKQRVEVEVEAEAVEAEADTSEPEYATIPYADDLPLIPIEYLPKDVWGGLPWVLQNVFGVNSVPLVFMKSITWLSVGCKSNVLYVPKGMFVKSSLREDFECGYTKIANASLTRLQARKLATHHMIPYAEGCICLLAAKDLIPYFSMRKKYKSYGNFQVVHDLKSGYVDIKETTRVNELYKKQKLQELAEKKEQQTQFRQQLADEAIAPLDILRQAKLDLLAGKKPNYEGFDYLPLVRAYGTDYLEVQHIPFKVTNDIVRAMEIKVLYEKIVNVLPSYRVTMREHDAAIIVLDFDGEARAILRLHGIKYTVRYGCQNQYGRASYGRKYMVDLDLAKEILAKLFLSSGYMDMQNGKVLVHLPRCYDEEVEHIIKGWTGVRGHDRHLADGRVIHIRPHVRAVVERSA